MGAEAAGPFLILAERLSRGLPPRLVDLIARLEPGEGWSEFMNLVHEYLPEHEAEILCEGSVGGQIMRFATRFHDRYFPLSWQFEDGLVDEYEQLTFGIPLAVMGVGYDDYHELPSAEGLGIRLMTYVLADPFEHDTGVHLALADSLDGEVPAELLRRVPETGLSHEETKRLTGTRWEGLHKWSLVLNGASHNPIINTCPEDLDGYTPIDWTRENVEGLTRDWQEAEAVMNEVKSLETWLAESPARRFKELVDHLWPETEAGPGDCQVPRPEPGKEKQAVPERRRASLRLRP